MELYYKQQSFGGFPRHLWARSPRDFFMYDVGPAPSPYNYGFGDVGGVGVGSYNLRDTASRP